MSRQGLSGLEFVGLRGIQVVGLGFRVQEFRD